MNDLMKQDIGECERPRDVCMKAMREPTALEELERFEKRAILEKDDIRVLINMLPRQMTWEQNGALMRLLSRIL